MLRRPGAVCFAGLLAGLLSVPGAAMAAEATMPAPAASAPSLRAPSPADQKDKVSYATGVQAVRNFTRNDIAFSAEQMIQGIRDALAGGDLVMSDKEIRLVLQTLQTDLRRNMASNQKALAEKNGKRGSDFLAVYKARPGVQTLANGVAYRLIQQGSGARPTESQEVLVKYRGTSIDGVEFDATEDGKTALMKVNQLIMGWREAIKQMPTGARWEIVIPPSLAYGDRGVGTVVGPNETLVIDVELVGIAR